MKRPQTVSAGIVIHRSTWDIGMTSADVIEIYSILTKLGIYIWIDGGWGVDALLGRQTRPHKDLDIAIEDHLVAGFERFLASRGYRRTKREIERPFNFVLADDNGREIDVHVISLDEKGNGNYGPPEKGVMYPADSLAGSGTIEGHAVRCISPEWMVRFHSGYVLTEKDYKDVSALCEKYGIELPKEYYRFRSRG
jgi:lincosamide nucleotidyltransferase A/C/D/E